MHPAEKIGRLGETTVTTPVTPMLVDRSGCRKRARGPWTEYDSCAVVHERYSALFATPPPKVWDSHENVRAVDESLSLPRRRVERSHCVDPIGTSGACNEPCAHLTAAAGARGLRRRFRALGWWRHRNDPSPPPHGPNRNLSCYRKGKVCGSKAVAPTFPSGSVATKQSTDP